MANECDSHGVSVVANKMPTVGGFGQISFHSLKSFNFNLNIRRLQPSKAGLLTFHCDVEGLISCEVSEKMMGRFVAVVGRVFGQ